MMLCYSCTNVHALYHCVLCWLVSQHVECHRESVSFDEIMWLAVWLIARWPTCWPGWQKQSIYMLVCLASWLFSHIMFIQLHCLAVYDQCPPLSYLLSFVWDPGLFLAGCFWLLLSMQYTNVVAIAAIVVYRLIIICHWIVSDVLYYIIQQISLSVCMFCGW